ncbi:diguanylate cyclase [Stappia sp. BW2]|uniref:GGDEF domain-containing protein n=1 Tax=Stappia sp. BW2 TaxID=2592622 RepID=UPI0011DED37F|nr:diguanylate cyclase [Stappia sp. BW2]TYC65296.1 diguanylate cyclase [Stappia sp. BW2]
MVSGSNRDTPLATDLLHPSGIDFETLVKLGNEAIVLIGFDGTPTFISPAAERLFGWSAEKLADHLSDLVYLATPDADADHLHRILCGSGDAQSPLPHAELQLRSAFGSLVWAEVSTHLLRDSRGAAYAFAVYFRSIAKRKELESRLDAATQTDPLTGLLNRRAFEEGLKREWAIALREKTHTSLIKVSLDRFEALAEHFGPGAAEECLTKVAETLKETARRPADIAARTATAEFSLLLPRTHQMGAETISAYLHLAIQDLGIPNPDNTAGNGVMTASVGAACAVVEQTGISESSELILAAAESCVFQARQEGGNRVKSVLHHLTR